MGGSGSISGCKRAKKEGETQTPEKLLLRRLCTPLLLSFSRCFCFAFFFILTRFGIQTAKETASGSAGWSRPRVPPHWHKFASALAFLGKLTVKTELDHPQFK